MLIFYMQYCLSLDIRLKQESLRSRQRLRLVHNMQQFCMWFIHLSLFWKQGPEFISFNKNPAFKKRHLKKSIELFDWH